MKIPYFVHFYLTGRETLNNCKIFVFEENEELAITVAKEIIWNTYIKNGQWFAFSIRKVEMLVTGDIDLGC